MTMPIGVEGLEPEAWMGQWALTNNLKDLHERTRDNIEEYYSTQVNNEQGWTNVIDFATNIAEGLINALPTWLDPIKPILLWLADTFSEAFQNVFTVFGNAFTWLYDNIGGPAIQAITEGVKWLWDAFGGTMDTIFKPLFGFLHWLWDGFGDAAETFLKPIITWLAWFWTEVGHKVEAFLKPVVHFLDWLWDEFGDLVESFMKPVTTFLHWLWTEFGDVVNSFLQPVIHFLKWVWDSFGNTVETFLKPVLNFLNWLWNGFGSQVNSFLKPVINWLSWLWQQFGARVETFLKPFITFGAWLWDTFENTVESILKPIFEWLKWLFGIFTVNGLQEIFSTFKVLLQGWGGFSAWIDSLPGFGDIITMISHFTGRVGATIGEAFGHVVDWAENIPFVGPIVRALLGGWKNPATNTNDTLNDLSVWANRQLTVDTIVPSQNLVGAVPQELISLLPIGHIGDAAPNLVTDQGFSSASALQAGAGWSWDATTAAGSSGGSAKVVGDGGVKQLFSNLISVSAGQKLSLSVTAKWTKGSTATPVINIGVRGYDGATVKFTTTVASVTARSGYTSPSSSSAYTVSSATTASLSDGWVTFTGNFTVPVATLTASSVTSIRMFVGVSNAPSSTTVWFDESVMKKTSLLPQNLVSELTTTLGGKLPQTDFQELLNRVAQKTGSTLYDVEVAVANYLTTGSTLNGSKIQSGNISSAFIAELGATWGNIYSGVRNDGPVASATINMPTDALRDFSVSMSNQGSIIQSNTSDIQRSSSRLDSAELAINQLYTSVSALQTKVGSAQSPAPVVGPTIVSVLDDFERTSLGPNWTVSTVKNADGSTLGIPNGHDAIFVPPTFSRETPAVAAVYNSLSNTEYQRVFATLGSAAGDPLIGAPGFNDLITRCNPANPLTGVVARFYGNGVIRVFYRTAGWEANLYGPATEVGWVTAPSRPTTGTLLEFYGGNKAVSNPNEFVVKMGTATWKFYISSSVLAVLGYGWGFGMGNGISGLVPQRAGSLNYWGAQDQTG